MCVGLEVFYSVAGADTSDFHERATLIDSTPHRRGMPMSEQALCGACSHVKVCGQIPPDKMPCDQYTYDRPPAIDREGVDVKPLSESWDNLTLFLECLWGPKKDWEDVQRFAVNCVALEVNTLISEAEGT